MTVNKVNINALADFIEAQTKYEFDMQKATLATCKTAGCIGGFAAALWPEIQTEKATARLLSPYVSWDDSDLRAKLGLDKVELDALCYPGDHDVYWGDVPAGVPTDYEEISRHGAIQTLRRLAKTGKVEWLFDEQRPEKKP